MSTSFVNSLEQNLNHTTTENGANAYRSTGSKVLNLFAAAGGLRLNKRTADVVQMFAEAYAEDKTLALRTLFYLRDVRGGQGEREIFRLCLNYLAKTFPKDVDYVLSYVPEFGRWDDLYAFYGTQKFEDAMNLVSAQIRKDIASDEAVSLCAKWLKSENTSSKQSRAMARATAKALKLKVSAYRKTLSSLRAKIDLLETKISKGGWSQVDYSKIPSQASMKYKKAFGRHDQIRFGQFLTKAASGEVKMNAGTLYPHQVVGKLLGRYSYDESEVAFAEAAWKNLPDYFGGREEDMLVVADVSGSMAGEPMNVSVALALYAAEHNQGIWKGRFMTFSERPQLVKVVGDNLFAKVQGIAHADWGMNTNLEAVFDTVLKAAQASGSMVGRIVIVSDMEFDKAAGYSNTQKSFFDAMSDKFQRAGFQLPGVVFWNVRARPNHQPAMAGHGNVQLVSGCSASTFGDLIKGEFQTPYDYMLGVINAPRYEVIKVGT